MTQRDPDPASLPEAIPVLSYERQTDDGAMEWVVGFIGVWAICNGATSVIAFCIEQSLPNSSSGFSWTLSLLCGLTSILFGIAIMRRQRYGFYGRLAVLGLYPAISSMPWLFTYPGLTSLHSLLTAAVPATGAFAATLSILRRADAKGALQPVREIRLETPQDGSSIGFLISRTGWMLLAQGGVVVVHLAMWPLLIWAKFPVASWNWQSSVYVALMLALALGGLLMCQRMAWAIWLVVAALPLANVLAPLLVMWQYYFPNGFAFSSQVARLIPSAIGATANVIMLCLLARRAARTAKVMD